MIYALYRGDVFLYVGSLAECAEWLGVKTNTIDFMSSPAHHKRKGDKAIKVYRYEEE